MFARRIGAVPRADGSTPAIRDERGAVAVEAAIVTMFLLTIVAGIVDVSMYLQTTYQMTLGSRAAARTASTDPIAPTFAQNAALQVSSAMKSLEPGRVTKIWVYKADITTGNPLSGPACASACYRFTLDANGNIASTSGSWPSRSACAGGVVDPVGVLVEYRYNALFMFFDEQTVSNRTVMRLEPIPSTSVCVAP